MPSAHIAMLKLTIDITIPAKACMQHFGIRFNLDRSRVLFKISPELRLQEPKLRCYVREK